MNRVYINRRKLTEQGFFRLHFTHRRHSHIDIGEKADFCLAAWVFGLKSFCYGFNRTSSIADFKNSIIFGRHLSHANKHFGNIPYDNWDSYFSVFSHFFYAWRIAKEAFNEGNIVVIVNVGGTG